MDEKREHTRLCEEFEEIKRTYVCHGPLLKKAEFCLKFRDLDGYRVMAEKLRRYPLLDN